MAKDSDVRELLRAATLLAEMCSALDEFTETGEPFEEWGYHGTYLNTFVRWMNAAIEAPRPVWQTVNTIHNTAVAFGGLAGRSFSEIALKLAEQRYLLLREIEGRPITSRQKLTYRIDGPHSASLIRRHSIAELDAEIISANRRDPTTGRDRVADGLAEIPAIAADVLAIHIEKEFPQVVPQLSQPDGDDNGDSAGGLVTGNAATVLRVLLKEHPRLLKQEEIAGAIKETLSVRSISDILRNLRSRNLISKPNGKRQGDQLTDAGKKIAETLP